jgi:hypothetical protein
MFVGGGDWRALADPAQYRAGRDGAAFFVFLITDHS